MPATNVHPAAELIDRLGRLIRTESHGAGLNPAQWEAMRYLARCNRFSNTAGALTQYLGVTKGTVSQTLNALERKKLVIRRQDPASGRVVRLVLSATGRALVGKDPLIQISNAAAELPPAQLATITDALAAVLSRLQMARGLKPFGACRTCRHFNPDAAEGRPHWCALMRTPLTEPDSTAICVEHEPRAA